jgi:long-chain fatty acid transport protein
LRVRRFPRASVRQHCPWTSSSASAPAVQYSINDNVTVGAAYEYMNGGDNNIDVQRGPLAGRLEGDYKSFDFHFFALNVIWRL